MTREQAKSELMQIYMSLSEEKKQALDVLMAQAEKTCDIEKSNFDVRQYKLDIDTAYECGYNAGLQAQADGEYISREAVMDCYKKWQPYMATRLHEFEKELSELPSVAIPNKVGHWEYNQYDGNPNIGNWHCSECRNIVSDMPTCMGKPLYEFCPKCGCPMEIER